MWAYMEMGPISATSLTITIRHGQEFCRFPSVNPFTPGDLLATMLIVLINITFGSIKDPHIF